MSQLILALLCEVGDGVLIFHRKKLGHKEVKITKIIMVV